MKELTLEEIRIRGTAYKEGMREGRTQTLEKVKEKIKILRNKEVPCADRGCKNIVLDELLSQLEDDEVKE